MGYWVGMTTKSGSEANFYVEDDNGTKRYYNGKDKRHEYRNEEPYDLIKDHTKLVKKIEKAFDKEISDLCDQYGGSADYGEVCRIECFKETAIQTVETFKEKE